MAPHTSKKNKPKKSKSKAKQLKKTKCTKKNSIGLKELLKQIKKYITERKPQTITDALSMAVNKVRKINKKIRPARVIPIPKVGGFLPLIPLFAGLSALGALGGGAAGIAKAVNDAKAAKQELEEKKRHNTTMEKISMGKGLFLKPYKTGLGLFLSPSQIIKNYR